MKKTRSKRPDRLWEAFNDDGVGFFDVMGERRDILRVTTAFLVFPIAWVEMIIGAWIASKLYTTGLWAG